MLYLTCTMMSSVVLACYGVSRAKDWVSVDYGTKNKKKKMFPLEQFSLQKLTQFWKGFFIKEGGQSEVSVQNGRRKMWSMPYNTVESTSMIYILSPLKAPSG